MEVAESKTTRVVSFLLPTTLSAVIASSASRLQYQDNDSDALNPTRSIAFEQLVVVAAPIVLESLFAPTIVSHRLSPSTTQRLSCW
jgi:hypothetical protein